MGHFTVSKGLLSELRSITAIKKRQKASLLFVKTSELFELQFLYARKRRIRLHNENTISTGEPLKKHFFTPGQFTKVVDGSLSYSQRIFGPLRLSRYWHSLTTSKLSIYFSRKLFLETGTSLFHSKALPISSIFVYNFHRKIAYLFTKRRFNKYVKRFANVTTTTLSDLASTVTRLIVLFRSFLLHRVACVFFSLANFILQ